MVGLWAKLADWLALGFDGSEVVVCDAEGQCQSNLIRLDAAER